MYTSPNRNNLQTQYRLITGTRNTGFLQHDQGGSEISKFLRRHDIRFVHFTRLTCRLRERGTTTNHGLLSPTQPGAQKSPKFLSPLAKSPLQEPHLNLFLTIQHGYRVALRHTNPIPFKHTRHQHAPKPEIPES